MRVLLLSLLFLPLTPSEVVATLRPTVVVAAERATLAAVAELTGDPALIAVVGDLPVVELPDLRMRRLEADEVQRAIGLGLGGRLRVVGECAVSRQGQVISEAELVAAARGAIRADGDEVVITTLRSSGAVTVPAGGSAVVLAAETLGQVQSGDVPVRVRVLRGESEIARALLILRVVRQREVLVATRAIRRGTILGPADLRRERVTVGRHPLVAATVDELIGREARLDVAEGTPLTATLVVVPPAVRVGQRVQMVVSSDRFQLTAVGEALADGRIGETIGVRRGADGRTVRGTVIAEAQVRVDH
jgi:flagella basal body P-ring formation protein FlgA